MKWYEKIVAKLSLKAMIKGCNKLITKNKSLDLNKNDKNDLLEWKEWCEKALEQVK